MMYSSKPKKEKQRNDDVESIVYTIETINQPPQQPYYTNDTVKMYYNLGYKIGYTQGYNNSANAYYSNYTNDYDGNDNSQWVDLTII